VRQLDHPKDIMYKTTKPEARTTRDGLPVESGSPRTRVDTFEAFQPALDDELPENTIDAAIAEVFGAPVPPTDPFAEPTPVPRPFAETTPVPNPFGETPESNEI
jgi:hypothetical protein